MFVTKFLLARARPLQHQHAAQVRRALLQAVHLLRPLRLHALRTDEPGAAVLRLQAQRPQKVRSMSPLPNYVSLSTRFG